MKKIALLLGFATLVASSLIGCGGSGNEITRAEDPLTSKAYIARAVQFHDDGSMTAIEMDKLTFALNTTRGGGGGDYTPKYTATTPYVVKSYANVSDIEGTVLESGTFNGFADGENQYYFMVLEPNGRGGPGGPSFLTDLQITTVSDKGGNPMTQVLTTFAWSDMGANPNRTDYHAYVMPEDYEGMGRSAKAGNSFGWLKDKPSH